MGQDCEITRKLHEWSKGNREALDELIPLVYGELHKQAARFLSRERSDHTLQTTALIHEAYLKLVDQNRMEWENRSQFFGIAANLMRRVLIDYARTRKRKKRGGENETLLFEENLIIITKERNLNLLALDEALNELAEVDERQIRIVELRYFSGLSLEETAEALHISRATAAREWNVSRAWLRRELTR